MKECENCNFCIKGSINPSDWICRCKIKEGNNDGLNPIDSNKTCKFWLQNGASIDEVLSHLYGAAK